MDIGIFILVAGISVVIGTWMGCLIGGFLLRAAIALYNKVSTPATRISEPRLRTAMGIIFATSCANIIVSLAINFLVGQVFESEGINTKQLWWFAQVVAAPVSVAIMTAMLAAMLPTTVGRAFQVTLCYMLVAIVIIVPPLLALGLFLVREFHLQSLF
jgi:hypothetical protein